MSQNEQGILWVVATPIGNLSDMSPRAIRTLQNADLVLAEDTRHTKGLLRHFEIQTPLKSLHEHNEEARTPALLAEIQEGLKVAMVTDAGTPAISDPGGRFVSALLDEGIKVSPIPGPTALVAALSVAGLAPMDEGITFYGFVPHKGASRKKAIARACATEGSVVLFEAPHRITQTLSELAEHQPQRKAVVCRELTKIHEEVRKGALEDLATWSQKGLKGEIVIVLDRYVRERQEPGEEEVDNALKKCLAAGLSSRDASTAVAALLEKKKRPVYQRCMELQKSEE
jgi:16S rRNA (cytidine1402-2'-O)-methyltransferase